MKGIRLWRAAAAWLVVAAALAFAPAAQAKPTVRLVLQMPASASEAGAGSAGGGRPVIVSTDRLLPASEEFDVELPDPEAMLAVAILELWPRDVEEDRATCADARPTDAPQSYQLGMTPAGTGSARVFRATAPPLQMGVVFCIRATLGLQVSREDIGKAVAAAADAFVKRVGKEISREDYRRRLEVEVKRALGSRARAVDVPAVAESTVARTMAAAKALLAREAELRAAEEKLDAKIKPADLAEAKADLDHAKAISAEAKAELEDSVKSALEERLIDLSPTTIGLRLETKAGAGATPDAGSYAAIDTGVAVGFPFHGNHKDTWWFPYVGVNLYLTPVERKVALDELVGKTIRQRLSLTVGVTLTAPPISGRTVETLVFARYPMVAVGCRLSHYLRFSVGAAFYRIQDKNPLSADKSLGVSPFAGLSVDADVVSIVKSGI